MSTERSVFLTVYIMCLKNVPLASLLIFEQPMKKATDINNFFV